MKPQWLYEGLLISEIPDTNAYGFIYKITYKDPITGEIKFYIGKKQFYSERNVKKGKKELAAMTDRRGSKKKKVNKESDWLKYQSSNEFLKTTEPWNLEKEILMLCYTKTELTYQETKHLFVHGVLESDLYLNGNILSKFFKTK
jgi:hypothetical protein